MMQKEEKRGLSTIVVTLIIILVSLVAIGVIWIVVRNVIQTGSQQISMWQFSLDAKIMNVNLENNSNNINLTVKRNPGEGGFNSLKFIFYDGRNSEVVTQTISLSELEERRFNFHLNILNVSQLMSISIVPVFIQNGKETVGSVLDKYMIAGNEQTQPPSSCTPTTCLALGYQCGIWGNGTCSGNLNCGTCSSGYSCNATGSCASNCTPATCSGLGYTCGTWANGTCSGTLNCGTCGTGYTCNATGSCVDTTPPTRSSGVPTGILPAGTTQTNMSLVTNEVATCRYSNISGIAYASMTNTFTGTLLSHSKIITGLTNGTAYNYYVRCNDTAGNVNTNDYVISFSVGSGGGVPLVGLVAYYPFSGNANDASGNGNNGIIYGAVLTQDKNGNPNSAYYFDGINDNTTIADSSVFHITGSLSVSAWIKKGTNPAGVWQSAVSRFAVFGGRDGFLLGTYGDEVELAVNSATSYYECTTSSINLDTSSYYHVVGVFDDPNNTIRLYVNGVEQATTPGGTNGCTPPISLSGNAAPLYIGTDNFPENFNGTIDEVRIYNRILTQSEITSLLA